MRCSEFSAAAGGEREQMTDILVMPVKQTLLLNINHDDDDDDDGTGRTDVPLNSSYFLILLFLLFSSFKGILLHMLTVYINCRRVLCACLVPHCFLETIECAGRDGSTAGCPHRAAAIASDHTPAHFCIHFFVCLLHPMIHTRLLS